MGTLKVSGYVRSRALSVNKLVHITGVGDFQLLQVSGCGCENILKDGVVQFVVTVCVNVLVADIYACFRLIV